MDSPNITARGNEVSNLLPTLQVGDIKTQCQLPLDYFIWEKGRNTYATYLHDIEAFCLSMLIAVAWYLTHSHSIASSFDVAIACLPAAASQSVQYLIRIHEAFQHPKNGENTT